MNIIINTDGAVVVHVPGWLASRLDKIPGYQQNPFTLNDIANCLHNLQYTRPIIKIFGYEGPTPRDQLACGNTGLTAHNYTGTSVTMTDWDNTNDGTILGIKYIRDLILADTDLMQLCDNCPLNSCLVNYYRSGEDYVGYHADKELRDPMQTVFTVTLGTTRPFVLKNNETKEVIKIFPAQGDLVLMTGKTQKLWKHSVPKLKCNTGRISLTYREL